MKVIFLDCDGVINNHWYMIRNHKEIRSKKTGASTLEEAEFVFMTRNTDPSNMVILKHILDNVQDARIVIESSWRRGRTTQMFKTWMNHFGVDPERVIGVLGSGDKGEEVKRCAHKYDDFIVLEDHQIFEDDPLQSKVYLVDPLNGLTYRDAVDIISKLNPEWKPPVVLM